MAKRDWVDEAIRSVLRAGRVGARRVVPGTDSFEQALVDECRPAVEKACNETASDACGGKRAARNVLLYVGSQLAARGEANLAAMCVEAADGTSKAEFSLYEKLRLVSLARDELGEENTRLREEVRT